MSAARSLAQAPELHLPAGTMLFRQGDPGEEMFVISRGRVRLMLMHEDHEKEIGLLGPGDFFGELSLLYGAPRTASAQIVEDTTLVSIRRDVFAMMMQDDLDVVFRMMNVIGQRLGHGNDRVRGQMQRLAYLQILGHAVRRGLAALPAETALDLDATAREIGMAVSELRAGVEQAVLRGAGTLREGRWLLDRAALQALAEELYRTAASQE
jgi:CRP/FNR family transcriptional regulator, cyclic AMP receptor protein